MWNMPFSPAVFARMTPRERMHASLNGVGNQSSAVESRGLHGEFQDLVQNTLNAPRIGTMVTGGAYSIAPSNQRFGPSFARPLGIQRTHPSGSVLTGSQVVRGAANLGDFGYDPGSLMPGGAAIPTGLITSRALPPPTGTPTPVAPVNPALPGGSGVQDTTGQTTSLLQPATVTATIDPAQLPASSTPGLPLWQLGLGAAAVFGGIWYLTRRA